MRLKRIINTLITSFLLVSAPLPAVIIETYNIEDIVPYITEEAFVLFNVTNVLIDSTISLGSPPWRQYIKSQTQNHGADIQSRIHDTLTLLVAQEVPHKSVEKITPLMVRLLQEKKIAVAALTSRGRSEWYNTEVSGIDDLTERVLQEIGIDFSRQKLPFIFDQDDDDYRDFDHLSKHYKNGIFYINDMEKGLFISQLLQNSGYYPKIVVFIDDKRDSLKNVEESLNEMGIPFIGFLYKRTTVDHSDFSPMVAHVQLEQLLNGQEPVSDEKARQIIADLHTDTDENIFFLQLLGMLGLD